MAEDPTAALRSAMPFCATLDVVALDYTPQLVRLALAWAPALCTAGGVLHGGALMALADSAGGACAFLNLPEGATGTATIESKTNFLGAVRAGQVVASARPLRVGSQVVVVETELTDDAGRMVGKTTQSQIVARAR